MSCSVDLCVSTPINYPDLLTAKESARGSFMLTGEDSRSYYTLFSRMLSVPLILLAGIDEGFEVNGKDYSNSYILACSCY